MYVTGPDWNGWLDLIVSSVHITCWKDSVTTGESGAFFYMHDHTLSTTLPLYKVRLIN